MSCLLLLLRLWILTVYPSVSLGMSPASPLLCPPPAKVVLGGLSRSLSVFWGLLNSSCEFPDPQTALFPPEFWTEGSMACPSSGSPDVLLQFLSLSTSQFPADLSSLLPYNLGASPIFCSLPTPTAYQPVSSPFPHCTPIHL